MRVRILRFSDIRACPQIRLDARHYRPDGSCHCGPRRDRTLADH